MRLILIGMACWSCSPQPPESSADLFQDNDFEAPIEVEISWQEILARLLEARIVSPEFDLPARHALRLVCTRYKELGEYLETFSLDAIFPRLPLIVIRQAGCGVVQNSAGIIVGPARRLFEQQNSKKR